MGIETVFFPLSAFPPTESLLGVFLLFFSFFSDWDSFVFAWYRMCTLGSPEPGGICRKYLIPAGYIECLCFASGWEWLR